MLKFLDGYYRLIELLIKINKMYRLIVLRRF